MPMVALWIVSPCIVGDYERFGGTCCIIFRVYPDKFELWDHLFLPCLEPGCLTTFFCAVC
jgi:hypothetical protein